jgi:hypothetical protein
MKFHANAAWCTPSLKPAYASIEELNSHPLYFNSEDEGSMFLRNVSIDLECYTAQKATM